ncbi:MAG: hypothetical protein ACYC4Q_02280 [Victivallaceae bacterium]
MPRVADNCNYYIVNSEVTFTEQEVSAGEMLEKYPDIIDFSGN